MRKQLFTGRVGSDAKLEKTAGGTPVVKFDVATEEYVGGKVVTEWLRCSLYGPRAEKLKGKLLQGVMVSGIGGSQVRAFKGKDGPAAGTEINLDDLDLLGGGKVRHDSGGDDYPTGNEREIDY
jgi:single-strand DNA-binding protein